jgi:hypothetical protein
MTDWQARAEAAEQRLERAIEELERRLKDLQLRAEDPDTDPSLIARIPAYETALRLLRASSPEPAEVGE